MVSSNRLIWRDLVYLPACDWVWLPFVEQLKHVGETHTLVDLSLVCSCQGTVWLVLAHHHGALMPQVVRLVMDKEVVWSVGEGIMPLTCPQ